MISSATPKHRLLIPRWRPLAVTIKSGELSVPAAKSDPFRPTPIPRELVKRLERWRRDRDVVAAAEVLESATILGQENVATAAARLLVQDDAGVTPLVRKQAERLLHRADWLERPTADFHRLPLRERIRENPRDALAWVELALAQMHSGNAEHAEMSMKVALQLAPVNRHVSRSAARLYFQRGDMDRAYHLVRRNPSTPHDPWLMAAEIALAMRLQKSPQFLKRGLQLIDNDECRPRQITELAGAAGTTVIADNRKRGRRLFRQSMADPTGNALAQAQWAEESFQEEFIAAGQLQRTTDAKEASAHRAYMAGDFITALAFAKQWLAEEPFSLLAHFAATASASAGEDFGEAENQSRNGLRYHPKSAHLRNWLVFSLASQGRLEDAEREVRRISFDEDDETAQLVSEANHGLIAMRQGDVALGEKFYRKAINGFRHLQQQGLARTALAFFAREAVQAGHPKAAELVAQAKDGVLPVSPVTASVVNTAERLLRERRSAPVSAGPSARR